MIVDKPTLPSWKIWLLAEQVFYIWIIYGFLKTISCVFWDFKKVTLFPPFFSSSKPFCMALLALFQIHSLVFILVFYLYMSKQELNSKNRNNSVSTGSQPYTKTDKQLFLTIMSNTMVACVFSISRFQFVQGGWIT